MSLDRGPGGTDQSTEGPGKQQQDGSGVTVAVRALVSCAFILGRGIYLLTVYNSPRRFRPFPGRSGARGETDRPNTPQAAPELEMPTRVPAARVDQWEGHPRNRDGADLI